MRLAAIYFDCDSTLSAIEGIDELGRFVSEQARRELAELTERAMRGDLPLAGVYGRRLERIAPTRQQVEAVGRMYVDSVVPDAADLVAALRSLGKVVGIVSGGLEPAVLALAAHLGIDAERVHAVPVRFDDDGRYLDFDRRSPLSRNGGKTEVLAARPATERPLCLVGDGVTDLEAAEAVDLFVGYGGVVRRPAVEERAPHYLRGRSLAPLLQLVLSDAETRTLARHPRFAPLLARTAEPPC